MIKSGNYTWSHDNHDFYKNIFYSGSLPSEKKSQDPAYPIWGQDRDPDSCQGKNGTHFTAYMKLEISHRLTYEI